MCVRPDFDRAQNEATKLLLRQDISSLFVDVRKFVFDRKIHIDSVQNYARILKRPITDFTCNEFSGCCVIPYARCNLVLFDDLEPNPFRKHWGIVHEVGHIYLDHEEDGEKEEKEANFFVAQIVAPEIILHEIHSRKGSLNEDDLTSRFNISYEAASKRITTLKRRHCYNNSDIDKLLLAKIVPVLDSELSKKRQPHPNYSNPLDCTEINLERKYIKSAEILEKLRFTSIR